MSIWMLTAEAYKSKLRSTFPSRPGLFLWGIVVCSLIGPGVRAAPVHTWETVEITLHATKAHADPYAGAQVWVDLEGPGSSKRCYGFWDGGNTLRVRMMATAPGTWTWRSGSETEDAGLAGQSGTFEAMSWTDAEEQANSNHAPGGTLHQPLRRATLRDIQFALEPVERVPVHVRRRRLETGRLQQVGRRDAASQPLASPPLDSSQRANPLEGPAQLPVLPPVSWRDLARSSLAANRPERGPCRRGLRPPTRIGCSLRAVRREEHRGLKPVPVWGKTLSAGVGKGGSWYA